MADGAGGRRRRQRSASSRRKLQKDDVLIDGGNSYYIDDIRRQNELRPKGIHYVDVGTSGGVWGLERGYCMMIGGDTDAVAAPGSDLQDARARARGHPAHARPREGRPAPPRTATSTAGPPAPATS